MRYSNSQDSRRPFERSPNLERRSTGRRRFFTLLALGIFLSACSSTGSAPVNAGAPDPWTAVQGIDRGADLQLSVDCTGTPEHEVCAAWPAGEDPALRVVIGQYVEADGRSLLFRPIWDEAELLRVDRGIVRSIDVLKEDSTFFGTVVGGVLGFTLCGAATTLADPRVVLATEKIMLAWMCGLPSAWIGHLIDGWRSGGKFTVVRIYERDVEPPRRARNAPHPWLPIS